MTNLMTLVLILAIRLITLIPYFGIGFLCYAHWVSDTINTGSAWFWAYLLAWPIILFASFFFYVAIAAAVICALIGGAIAVQHYWDNYQMEQRRKRHVAEKFARQAERRGDIIDL